MALIALTNCRLVHSEPQALTGRAVMVRDSRVVAITEAATVQMDWPECTRIIDLNGDYLAPGLIDLQVAIVRLNEVLR